MNKYLVRTFITLGVITFILTLSAIGLYFYALNAPDATKQNYPDLEPEYTPLPEGEINGLTELHQIYQSLDEDNVIQEWLNSDEVEQEYIVPPELKESALSYQLQIQETLTHSLQCNYAVEIDASFSEVFSLLGISNFLSSSLKQQIADNEQDLATQTLISSLTLAEQSSRLEGPLAPSLCQVALTNSALTDVINYLEHWPIPHSQAPLLNELIDNLPDPRTSLSKAMNFEFHTFKNVISSMAQAHPPFLQENKTIHIFATYYRELKKFLNADFLTDHSNLLINTTKFRNMSRLQMFLSDNAIWNGLIVPTASGMDHIGFKEDIARHIISKHAVTLLLSINSYKKDHGQVPASLADLVPNYIESIPLDPYSGKPLLYSKDKKLIWSIGFDYKNNHGVSKDIDPSTINNLECTDEPSLAIPF